MNANQLHDFFDARPGMDEAVFEGDCHDCGCEVAVSVKYGKCGFECEGGAVYQPFLMNDQRFVKCRWCFDTNKDLKNYQPTEVYARCVGYLRPVSQWNPGKQAEFRDRKMFDKPSTGG